MPFSPAEAGQATPRRVKRAAAALPQAAQAALFNVRGGRVRIDQIYGRFTAAADATITNLSLVANPTTGADVALCAATAITSQAAESIAGITGTLASALQLSAGGAIVGQADPVIVKDGTIDALTSAANAAARVEWICLYTPLDPGANVTPA